MWEHGTAQRVLSKVYRRRMQLCVVSLYMVYMVYNCVYYCDTCYEIKYQVGVICHMSYVIVIELDTT
jgi:hypothetical protein